MCEHRYIPTYKYYMAVSPLDGKVYLSDSQMRQVFRLRDNKDVADITNNVVVVAGTGQACPPIDGTACGNNGAATQARLIAPKGRVESVIKISPETSTSVLSKDYTELDDRF